MGQLLLLNECVCPGHELRLECTVVGGGFTVWRGSAFDCDERANQIQLRHTQFEHGAAVGECNNGKIIGSSLRRVDLNFTSQLIVQLDINSTLEGRTLACVHNNGSHETAVGMYTITYTTGKGMHYQEHQIVSVCIH